MYGGFAGDETERASRDWSANPTILSGDIDHNDTGAIPVGANAYHVLTGTAVGDTSIVDGFIIAGGHAEGKAPDDTGGGLLLSGAVPRIINCMFTGNTAGKGGALGIAGSGAPDLTNCLFHGNQAVQGGALHISGTGAPTAMNCTLTDNHADTTGGGICNDGTGVPSFTNCILWNNTAAEFPEIHASLTAPLVAYCCVTSGYDGTGNIGDDPLFVDAIAGDLRLQSTSPCINTGTGDGAPATDFLGISRPQGAGYDMGAYEMENVAIPHPADINNDWRLVLGEAIAYLTGWQQGSNPIGHAIRGAYLWQNGERYGYDASAQPPLCWILDIKSAVSEKLPRIDPATGEAVTVCSTNKINITVAPPPGTTVWGVEYYLPQGSTPSDIQGPNAVWNAENRKLSCWSTGDGAVAIACALEGAASTQNVTGTACFDGELRSVQPVEIAMPAEGMEEAVGTPAEDNGSTGILPDEDVIAASPPDETVVQLSDAVSGNPVSADVNDGNATVTGNEEPQCGVFSCEGNKSLGDWLLIGLCFTALLVKFQSIQ